MAIAKKKTASPA